jgi:hypothetical protein
VASVLSKEGCFERGEKERGREEEREKRKRGLVWCVGWQKREILVTSNFIRQIRATLQLPMDFSARYSQKEEGQESEKRSERKYSCLA